MKRGKKYQEALKLVDRNARYELNDAVALLKIVTLNLMQLLKLHSD